MADTQAYKVTSAKDPFDGTSRVLVSGDSVDDPDAVVAEVGGGPVELTEAQVENVKERFRVSKASEEDVEKAQAAGDQTAPTPPRGEGGAASVESPQSGKSSGGTSAGGSTSVQGAPAR